MSDITDKAEYEGAVNDVVTQGRATLERPMPPLPPQAAQTLGVSSIEDLKLVSREVVVEEAQCGAGHNHKNIMLIETFNAAGAAEGAAITELDAALEEFKAKALEIPEGSVQTAEFGAGVQLGLDPETNSVKKMLVLQTAFETAASLAAPQPQAQVMTLEDLLAMMGGQKPGGRGPGGLN